MVNIIHQQGYVGDLVKEKRKRRREVKEKSKIYPVVEISNYVSRLVRSNFQPMPKKIQSTE
jgi:hypothetical protein